MRRSTMKTAFAMLALIAGVAIASGGVSAEPSPQEKCENAWAASAAYGSCGHRSTAQGYYIETVEVKYGHCVVTTSYEYYEWIPETENNAASWVFRRRDTSASGKLWYIRDLLNCDGHLKLSC